MLVYCASIERRVGNCTSFEITTETVKICRNYSESNNDARVDYQRLYRLRNKDKLVDQQRNDESRMAYERQYYREVKEKNAERRNQDNDLKADYLRQYYLQNKDKMARRNGVDREGYHRRYYHLNKEKNAEFRNRSEDARTDYRRQYYLLYRKHRAEYCNLVDASRALARPQRQYYRDNRERNAEFRSRSDDSRAEYQRQYGRAKREARTHSALEGRTSQSWQSPEAVRDHFESLATRLNIAHFSDWYRVSRRQIGQYGGESLYTLFGSLGAALQFAFPEIKWDASALRIRGKKSGQRWLKNKLEEILPGCNIIEDYQHPDLNWGELSERNMELDLWLPQHRIGLEYQGEQHYYNMDVFGPSNGTGAYSERDTLKNNLCESRGITLIAIPYWWDGSVDSLSATLYQARPDVFPACHSSPIPLQIPVNLTANWPRLSRLGDLSGPTHSMRFAE